MLKFFQNLMLLRAHIWVGIVGALTLFVLFYFQALTSWSPMGWSYAFDYFTLPRCGLAIRFGTNPFESHNEFSWFGPVGTWWVSHPALCVILGLPLSYLPPWFGFWLLNFFFLISHILAFSLIGKSLPIAGSFYLRCQDLVCFFFLGFFFPNYVIYVLGQYHALVTLAVTLCLLPQPRYVFGFCISALGKPLLAPAALVLFIQKKFKEIAVISLVCFIAYGAWAFLRYDLKNGIIIALNPTFESAAETGSLLSKFTVPGWNQEMGLAKVLDEIITPGGHYHIRILFAIAPIITSVFLAFQKKHSTAIAVSVLWYFILYARGHEYHYSTLVPILTFLYTKESGEYRTPWFSGLIALCAMPTTFALIMALGGFANAAESTTPLMKENFPFLYWLFLIHRPATIILILAAIWKVEFVCRRRSNAATPSSTG